MTKLDALIAELLNCAKRNKCTDGCLHKGFCNKILKGRRNLTLAKVKEELAEDIYEK